jgi:hypothetical protein
MIVSFQNPGLIDPRVIQYMGVNVKENPNAIGYFGTGLKFAIATLLRNKQEINIWIGTERLDFSERSELIRGKPFNIIYMNSTALSITTDLGRNWELWMAMRELYSNVLDERGFAEVGPTPPKEGHTTIQVCGDAFYKAFEKLDEVFLVNRAPIWKNASLEIYSGTTSKLYYRGIYAGNFPKPMRYTYNVLTPLDLTEDRTIKSQHLWWYAVSKNVLVCTDSELIENIIAFHEKQDYESDADFDWIMAPSEQFLDSAGALGRRGCNETAWRVWLRSSRGVDIPEFEEVDLTPLNEKRLIKAKQFLKPLGYDDAYEIKIAADLGENVLGTVRNGRTVWLSHRVFDQGTKQVASTLYEEWLHLKHGFADRTYEMQTFLFDKILTLVETINGEPL